jgi:capsid protein
MSDDFGQSQFVAGVHPVGPRVTSPPADRVVRSLSTREPIDFGRAWDVLPENDEFEEQQHWRHAGRMTNELLVEWLRTLQDRCSDEFLGNPTVEGVIARHAVDVVGEKGPPLQVECVNWPDEQAAKAWADAAEKLWREVADAPTADGEDSWADWIAQSLAEDWLSGGTTDQIVFDAEVDHPIKTRLHSIDIMRLQTPPEKVHDPDTMLGITRNKFGRPTTYHFMKTVDPLNWSFEFDAPVPAAEVIHGYIRRRRGLLRGYPLLSGTLATAAAIRDLDQNIIDLVQTAAMLNVFAYTTSDLVDPVSKEEIEKNPIKLRRRGVTHVPPHMQLDSIQAHMPTPQYTDMRRERTGDIGRPAAMPGLTVHMDASGHNYSSARFDDRGYWRANARWQGFCARRRMNPYVHAVLREAETSGLLPPRQGEIRLNWQWPKSEGVDQQKEAMARRQRMQNFSASPIMVAAEEGADLERVIADNARFHDMLLSTGLDQQWVNAVMYTVFTGQTINPMANPGDSNADDDEPNQP